MSGHRENKTGTLTPAPDGYPIKLVRDRTPAIINASGEHGELFYGPVPDGERHRWLRLKLAEEVGEYLVDGGPSELRDVFVVVLELGLEHGMDLERLLAAVRADDRGLFRDGVMMYGRHPEFDRHPSQRSNVAPSTGANPALIRTQRPGGASAPAPPDAGQNQEQRPEAETS